MMPGRRWAILRANNLNFHRRLPFTQALIDFTSSELVSAATLIELLLSNIHMKSVDFPELLHYLAHESYTVLT
jgi:hypothetical protein